MERMTAVLPGGARSALTVARASTGSQDRQYTAIEELCAAGQPDDETGDRDAEQRDELQTEERHVQSLTCAVAAHRDPASQRLVLEIQQAVAQLVGGGGVRRFAHRLRDLIDVV